MMLISFTFNPSRESAYNESVELLRQHFPGVFRLGYSNRQINERGVRITCTSEEFCVWMVERIQSGFVNRMKQLDISIEYVPHISDRRQEIPPIPPLMPFKYSTPEATGVRR